MEKLCYQDALQMVKMHLATGSDQIANEASVQLTAWFIELMNDGARLAIVKDGEVEVVRIVVDESKFTIN